MSSAEAQEIATLKSKVRRLEIQLEAVYKHLGMSFEAEVDMGDDPKVIAAIKANNIVEAIKLYRASSNASLEGAKAAIEEIRARHGI